MAELVTIKGNLPYVVKLQTGKMLDILLIIFLTDKTRKQINDWLYRNTKPGFADKLSISSEIVNLDMGKQSFKAFKQIAALCTVAVAFFLIQHCPHQGITNAFIDDTQHQNIEMGCAKRSVDAVYAQNPRLGSTGNAHDYFGDFSDIYVK